MTLRARPALLASLFLSACTTAYSPPESGKTASLTLVNASNLNGVAHTYEAPVDCSNRRSLPNIAPKSEVTVNIPAGADWVLGFGWVYFQPISATSSASSDCIRTFSFLPQPGASYRALLEGDLRSCRITLTDASGQRVAVAQRRMLRGVLTDAGPFCRPFKPRGSKPSPEDDGG